MSLHSDDTIKLIKEAKRTQDSPFIPPFRDDLVRNSIQEAWYLTESIKTVLSNADSHNNMENINDDDNDDDENQDTHKSKRVKNGSYSLESAQIAATVNRFALDRTKRCLLAYSKHRLDRIIDIVWDIGGGTISSINSIPDKTKRNLSNNELEFIQGYTELISDYKGNYLDIDLGASLVPTKDLFIEIRVLKDCGEVLTENGIVKLTKNSQHYIKRSDVERFIVSGYLQQI